MKRFLLLFLLFPILAAAQPVPPSWTYTAEQLAVINQYGSPHHFAIVMLQDGKVRYEIWHYFGLIKKQYGFSNGAKVREVPLGFIINTKVTTVTPKQFTFNTNKKNLGVLFGPPGTVLPGQIQGVNQENLSYPTKGLSVTVRNGKMVGVATFPPVQ